MLPAVICEPNQEMRSLWMGVLDDTVREEFPEIKLESLPGAEHELLRAMDEQTGIMLVVLAVSDAMRGGVDRCIELFSSVMQRNRDSYVILSIHDEDDMNTVLSTCMRPAGILVKPLHKRYMQSCLRRVLSDYGALQSKEDDGKYLLLNTDKTLQRIPYKDIVYLEAQDKLLNVCTRRNVLRVRKSLSALEDTLPEDFLRCHRSYIVNRKYIAQIDLTDMMLEMTTQERLPFSRQYKDALRRAFSA